MQISAIFFHQKEAKLLLRQLQKLSARNIAALKCESQKTKCLFVFFFFFGYHGTPLKVPGMNKVEYVMHSHKTGNKCHFGLVSFWYNC